MLENVHHIHLNYFEMVADYVKWKNKIRSELPSDPPRTDFTKRTLPPVYHPDVDRWQLRLATAWVLLDIQPEQFLEHERDVAAATRI